MSQRKVPTKLDEASRPSHADIYEQLESDEKVSLRSTAWSQTQSDWQRDHFMSLQELKESPHVSWDDMDLEIQENAGGHSYFIIVERDDINEMYDKRLRRYMVDYRDTVLSLIDERHR